MLLICLLSLAAPTWGQSVVQGDFNGDGFADLVVGIPLEDVGAVGDAGAVQVLYGTPIRGLATATDQVFYQGLRRMNDMAEPDDQFGSILATGDFNGDGFADLALGIPLEDVQRPHQQGTASDAGAVQVLYGVSAGLFVGRPPAGTVPREDQMLHQDTRGMKDEAEGDDQFGRALAIGGDRPSP